MSQLGIEPGPLRWEAITLEKTHSNSLSEHVHMSGWPVANALDIAPPLAFCYMNIHEHTWTALGCGLNSTWKTSAKHLPAAKTSALASRHINCQTGQITSGSLLWRDLTKVIFILRRSQDWHVPAAKPTWASTVGGKHSWKDPFKWLVNSYSEHLYIFTKQKSTVEFLLYFMKANYHTSLVLNLKNCRIVVLNFF